MKNNCIVFLKGIIVLLLILLVVVGFSFGISFSSFVYSSNDHRAVEMYVSSRNYKIYINNDETNKYVLKPGNNILNIKIESLNKVDTYYKLVSNYEDNIYYYDSSSDSVIDSEETKNKKLLVYNDSNNNKNIEFRIESGYITNTIEDVKIKDGYYEISNSITTGQEIVYKDKNYKLLNISEDGIELLGEVIENEISLKGSEGFNKAINTINESINNLYEDENIISARSVNKEDIVKYFGNNVIRYISLNLEIIEDGFYIPTSLVNGEFEEEYTTSNFLTFPRIEINNEEFENNEYYDLFSSNKSYYIPSVYSDRQDNIEYGVFTISSGINKSKLYDSENKSYTVESNIRPIIVLSKNTNIKDID